MCGIFAAIAKPNHRLAGDTARRVDAALKSIAHRGPDASATWVDPTARFALGHVRLSIIDLREESNQPFWSECGRYGLVFNGEIYNYIELREQLLSDGMRFRTNSDTEVLLQAMIAWGTNAINRFNGMWAFVFVDLNTQSVIACRDRWGVKPLFVHDGAEQVLFASEAKAIIQFLGRVPEPDHESIGLYLKYSIGGEHQNSWFQGISRFPQSHFQSRSWSDSSAASEKPVEFWCYPSDRAESTMNEAQQRLGTLLNDAVRIRLRSDVPIGLSLSGGLDSSMLARIVREEFQTGLQAFTAWFKPKERSELPRAEKVAELFGHDLHPVEKAGAATVVADLRECIYHLDAGNSSPAIVPYLNLCRAAKKSLTVMIEGQGADELFFGYSYMFPFAAFGFIRNLQFGQALQTVWGQVRSDGLLRAAQEYARFASRGVYGNQYMQWDRGFLDRRVTSAASFPQSPRLSLTRHGELNASIQRHRNGLSNLLQYGDAISMAASLETRCPFLDFRLVEYGFQLPLDLLVRRGQGKFLLRHSVEGKLPHDVVWPRRKDGFANDTTPALRTAMRDGRIPNDAVDLSIELGLFTPKIKNIDAMMKVKDSPFFRIISTILWVDAFYGPRRVR